MNSEFFGSGLEKSSVEGGKARGRVLISYRRDFFGVDAKKVGPFPPKKPKKCTEFEHFAGVRPKKDTL